MTKNKTTHTPPSAGSKRKANAPRRRNAAKGESRQAVIESDRHSLLPAYFSPKARAAQGEAARSISQDLARAAAQSWERCPADAGDDLRALAIFLWRRNGCCTAADLVAAGWDPKVLVARGWLKQMDWAAHVYRPDGAAAHAIGGADAR